MSEQLDDLLPDLEGLDERYTREVLERAHQISQLTQHPGWSVYCDYLIALTGAHQTKVLEGYCDSFDGYRYSVGWIAGIREALKAPDRLASQVQMMHEQAVGDEEDVEF